MSICAGESGGNIRAHNPEYHADSDCYGSTGLFQCACVHGISKEKLFNPINNIELAYKLWQQSGWIPWGVCHDGTVDCKLAIN